MAMWLKRQIHEGTNWPWLERPRPIARETGHVEILVFCWIGSSERDIDSKGGVRSVPCWLVYLALSYKKARCHADYVDYSTVTDLGACLVFSFIKSS